MGFGLPDFAALPVAPMSSHICGPDVLPYSPGPLIRATLFKKGYPFALIGNYMDPWRVGLLLILDDGFDYFSGS